MKEQVPSEWKQQIHWVFIYISIFRHRCT